MRAPKMCHQMEGPGPLARGSAERQDEVALLRGEAGSDERIWSTSWAARQRRHCMNNWLNTTPSAPARLSSCCDRRLVSTSWARHPSMARMLGRTL